ncbi:MAG: 1-acyl-sn-glycerol-3-phosphate acyltransferase [Bacteroidetes bacterium]|nr:1-acyl-sn-glycerol-3-phosphate acyltransferase [Bacteroidota bacterium]
MIRLLLSLYWKIKGWSVQGIFPYHLDKMVIVVAPHTSWKDILVGFAARNHLKIYDAKFLGKKELFDGPFGFLFRWMGGTPVDRFSKQGMVEQVAHTFAAQEKFILAMAPEGTRKRVDQLRTGFYHIAKTARVPIVPVALDFEHKKIVIGSTLIPVDETADFNTLIQFFASVRGANPALDLHHLKK